MVNDDDVLPAHARGEEVTAAHRALAQAIVTERI